MRSDTSARHSERVQQALAYLAGRFAGPGGGPSLAELSRQTRTAPYYLHRIFREATGEPVQTYIRRLRLEYAAYRLLLSDLPVLDIAVDAGYESNPAFTRAFKRWLGTPPAAFRSDPDSASEDAFPAEEAPRLRREPGRTVAFVRYVGDYAGTARAWRLLAGELSRRGIDPAGTTAVGVVHDGPEYYLGGSLRYDACAVVDDPGPVAGGSGFGSLAPMATAGAPHSGPPELVLCTYTRLVLRLAIRSGAVPATCLPFYEVYDHFPVDGPAREPAAEVRVALR
jgi:AraC family transcriptional regulator